MMLSRYVFLLVACASLYACDAKPQDSFRDRLVTCAKGSPATAIEACNRLIDGGELSENGLAIAYFDRALAHNGAGQQTLALRDYDEALRHKPDFLEALSNRGSLHLRRNEPVDAAADFERAAKIAPKEAKFLVFLGWAYSVARNNDKAIATLDRAAKMAPSDARVYVARGRAHDENDEYALALADLDRAVALDPKFAAAWTTRGSIQRHLGRMTEAFRDYEQGVRLAPRNALSLAGRCWHRAVLKQDLDLALVDCTAAVQLDPGNASGYNTRALVYVRLAQYDKAIADYDRALGLVPKDAYSFFGRGIARRLAGDAEGGNKDIAVAAALDPGIAHEYAQDGIVP